VRSAEINVGFGNRNWCWPSRNSGDFCYTLEAEVKVSTCRRFPTSPRSTSHPASDFAAALEAGVLGHAHRAPAPAFQPARCGT
jgi:hypothetical protein